MNKNTLTEHIRELARERQRTSEQQRQIAIAKIKELRKRCAKPQTQEPTS